MALGVGHLGGGIAGLVRLIAEHGGALEYDLMTRVGATLGDIPGRIGWTALRSFVEHLDASSATVKETDPEIADWQGPSRLPMILADIYDLLAVFRWQYATANTKKGKKKPKKPEPYERPGAKREKKGTRVGRDPIPVSQFDAWWNGGDD